MSNNHFIGTSQELLVASMLTKEGLVVSLPLVDVGVDLLVSSKDFKNNAAIQVKFKSKEKNIFFTGKEVESYKSKNVYIAYFLNEEMWFMSFNDFLSLSEGGEHRKDNARYIVVKDKENELEAYKGNKGFMSLVSKIKNA